MYNVIYLGSSAAGFDYINCHDSFNVSAVVCDKKMVNNELLTCCFLREVPLIEIETYDDLLEAFNQRNGSFDFVIIYIFGMIIRRSLLQKYNFYNIHPGYLPYYKGRHSTFFATINGERSIGISLHEVIPEIDQGRIIARRKVPYYYWMGEATLREKLTNEIPMLLDELLARLTNPSFKSLENSPGHYYAPVEQEMININETMPISKVMNIIRSQEAYRGARFVHQQQTFFVRSAKINSWDGTDKEKIVSKSGLVLDAGQIIGIEINERYFLLFTEIIH